MNIALLKILGWSRADPEHVEELVEQFDSVVANSLDIVEAVSFWFERSVPTNGMSEKEKERFKQFLIGVAKRNRTAKKMARFGVGLKIAFTLFLGYTDVITDFLVAKSYYEVGELNTAYLTAGFAVVAILGQALFTFFQYSRKFWRERLGRLTLALLGLSPLIEGAHVWTGKEDPTLLLSSTTMYASMKAIEIGLESIPESIIQLGGLLKGNKEGVKGIQIIGVIISIVAGAFIMTDGNFGFILSKYLKCPGDPYYGWISKSPRSKRLQMLGMFIFNAFYFVQFVSTQSLFALSFNSRSPLFLLLGFEFAVVCFYMGYIKKELFGFAVISDPNPLSNTLLPLIGWAFYYMLVNAVPMLIAAAPLELGPEVFAGIVLWRLSVNGGVCFLALMRLDDGHYLNMGMIGYFVSLIIVVIGLILFFVNCDENFDRSLFWKAKSGKQHARDCWKDARIWEKRLKSKDSEIWCWVEGVHPVYLPIDLVTPWVCETLVGKYEDKTVPRLEWMNAKNESAFIKRIVKIYMWYGSDEKLIDSALVKLFGRSGAALENGIDKKLTFISSKKSKRNFSWRLGKIKPDE
ncbi:hypothetical protein TL16_g05029 [Triparma laevis f. inornata]|uniref:Uncharacterized protein n=1 Tax=Triparma laevis f. inornata TaxID=1714386 RepID=A0A9W7E825_9STRA|nr:hypothetical protein TL16_g05029 [Triparma laevis f. inornata]